MQLCALDVVMLLCRGVIAWGIVWDITITPHPTQSRRSKTGTYHAITPRYTYRQQNAGKMPSKCEGCRQTPRGHLLLRLRGGMVDDSALESESDESVIEGMQQRDVIEEALFEQLKANMPLDKDAEYQRAKEALLAGNFSGFDSIRQQWQNQSMRADKMSKGEELFWRLERYAHRWPPPWLPRMRNESNPVVFLDIAIRALDRAGTVEHEGRVTIELFAHLVPRTAENFRAFCTGEVLDPRMYQACGYKNTIFHRIVPGFLVQGGDLVKFDGTGCYSIYGGMRFADEDLSLRHSLGSVAMANAGPNTNGCQFFIVTCEEASFLDGRHVVVGHVLEGMETVTKIGQVPTIAPDFRPLRKVVVEECGQLLGPGPDWEGMGLGT